MKSPVFTGSGVALVTPMNSDGSVNFKTLDKLIEFHIKNGTDAIISCGTTGEASTLSRDEHIKVVARTCERVNGRIPVIAGTGSNDTAFSVITTKMAKSAGADAVLSVTPYYNKTSQKGLIAHFTHIADRSELPVILYCVPSRTGVDIKPETYEVLSRHPNIAGTKDASGNVTNTAKIISLCGEDFTVYSGEDTQVVPMMSLGAKGVISVTANIAPCIMHEITKACLDGNFKKAGKMQIEYLRLITSMFIDVNPIPVKYALNLLGFDCGECRLPLVEMSSENKLALEQSMKQYGLID